jgi:hypothetical protein
MTGERKETAWRVFGLAGDRSTSANIAVDSAFSVARPPI